MQKVKQVVLILLFIAAHLLIARNVFLLSRDMLLGDGSATKIFPALRYGFERIPDKPATRLFNAQDRLAVDFAQIYFPAQQMDALSQNYQNGSLDPLQRPSRYAPLLHYLCSLTICRLDYGPASLLHMFLQVLLFYAVFVYSFMVLKAQKYLLPGFLLLNACLFLTPAGLSWFERGQFSVYISIGYLLLVVGLIKRSTALVLCSALFAFIKWTSLPTMFVILGVFIFSAESFRAGRRNILLALAFLVFLLALCLPFPAQMVDFLKGLYTQERFALPGGISLAKILPIPLAKLLPLPLIMLGVIHVRMNQGDLERAVPFFAGAAILLLTYPTLAYEYNLPSLLFLIPLLFYWARSANDRIPARIRAAMLASFFVFVFLASYSNYINQKWVVMAEYLLISLILLVIPLIYSLPFHRRRKNLGGSPSS